MSLSVGSVSTNGRLTGGGDSIVVTNTTGAVGYIRFGSDATVTATTMDMPILANDRLILSVNSLITYAAAIATSGSGNIFFSRGDGSII